mmetsp:Transcript_12599/g.26000  ORF Transcript_12599/g.26000 Transcript_12599/m.26000 type:complete len:89 (+) Transcript_12599:51-317(+)
MPKTNGLKKNRGIIIVSFEVLLNPQTKNMVRTHRRSLEWNPNSGQLETCVLSTDVKSYRCGQQQATEQSTTRIGRYQCAATSGSSEID